LRYFQAYRPTTEGEAEFFSYLSVAKLSAWIDMQVESKHGRRLAERQMKAVRWKEWPGQYFEQKRYFMFYRICNATNAERVAAGTRLLQY